MMTTTHALRFALLLALTATLWTGNGALADPVFPSGIDMAYIADPTHSKQVRVRYENKHYVRMSTVGLNYCKAKDTLPTGWDTQDDRRLRTDSMCAEAPKYGSLGQDIDRFVVRGVKTYLTPDGLEPGRYVVSINFWIGTIIHGHAHGNHTSLALVDLQYTPNKKCLNHGRIGGPVDGKVYCQRYDLGSRYQNKQ